MILGRVSKSADGDLMNETAKEEDNALEKTVFEPLGSDDGAEAIERLRNYRIEESQLKLDTIESDGASKLIALSDAKENHDLTTNQRFADVKFPQILKLTCGDLEAQWAKRSATRAAEIKAVSETRVILTEDSAQDHCNKSGAS